MNREFTKVTIIGGGLLGGSLALALGRLETTPRVSLWCRRRQTADEAMTLGIPGATSILSEAVENADLLVLAVPVGAMADLLEASIQTGLPDHCLITDVGSVKQKPHRALKSVLEEHPQMFIGSHPMAGSEQGGIRFAASDLFKEAACLLTNDESASKEQTSALERFWQSVGCRTSWTTAKEHDALVARISHLPHIAAAAAAKVCLANPSDGAFGGGGLRDTTRVAGGHPGMWTEILSENREAIREPLSRLITELNEILIALETMDQEATRQWLDTAKNLRDQLNSLS